LGLPLLFTAGNLAFFDCGGVRLMLGPAETPELDHPSSILYFRVKDINAGHQLLLERRVQIVAPPRLIAPMPAYDLWMMGFRDTEGNIMELMSEVPRPA
jgi:methylmalonyl-CoA/ethylmalonyl-CoA epimerase